MIIVHASAQNVLVISKRVKTLMSIQKKEKNISEENIKKDKKLKSNNKNVLFMIHVEKALKELC